MDMLRGGWGPGMLGNGMGVATGGGSSYDAATEAIAAAFTTPPTTARKNLIDAAVVSLKSAGVWAKLDALYAFAAADAQAAKINWKAPGTYNATEVNAPTFTADQGFTGAATKYIDSGFNPTTATTPNFVQNSASAFAWGNKASPAASEVTLGQGVAGINDTFMYPRFGGDLLIYGVNAGSNTSVANTDGSGLFALVRTGASATQSYRNGAALGSGGTVASTTPANASITFMFRTSVYYSGTVHCGGFGSQLSAADNTALYNALNTYMAGLSSYQAETNAIAAAFTTPPTTARKNLIDAAVVALKAAGVWTKLDCMYVLAAADSQAARVNWKAPGTFTATEVNSPAFVADRGFTSGSFVYLDPLWNAAANGVNFQQNSASLHFWSNTNMRVDSGPDVGAFGVSSIASWNASIDTMNHALNSTGSNSFAPGSSIGFFSLSRTSAADYVVYKDATVLGTQTATSAALSSGAFYLVGGGGTAAVRQSAMAAWGGGLNSTEQTALYNALRTYMTGVGVP